MEFFSYGDPGFSRHHMIAQFWGAVAIRLAEDDVLPLEFATYASEVARYVAMAKRYAVDEFSAQDKVLDESVWLPLDQR